MQIASGGKDRVHRVIRVGIASIQGIHPILQPGCGLKLHPPLGASARHRQVAAVVRLDLIDRGEDLPRHAVLDRGRPVDRQQKQRDAIEAERLSGCGRAGELCRQRPGLRGHELRRGCNVVGARCRLGALGAARCRWLDVRSGEIRVCLFARGGLLFALHDHCGRFHGFGLGARLRGARGHGARRGARRLLRGGRGPRHRGGGRSDSGARGFARRWRAHGRIGPEGTASERTAQASGGQPATGQRGQHCPPRPSARASHRLPMPGLVICAVP